MGDAEPRGGSVKQRLRAAATRLFAQRGYATTSIAEVCQEAGVSKGAFYHHYPCKDALLFDIYQPLLALQTAHLVEIVRRPRPVLERLHDAAVDVVRTSLDHLDDLKVFLESMHLLAPETRQRVRQGRQAYLALFMGLVAEGQAAGMLRQDVSPELLSRHFFGPAHELVMDEGSTALLEQQAWAEAYADLWINGARQGGNPV